MSSYCLTALLMDYDCCGENCCRFIYLVDFSPTNLLRLWYGRENISQNAGCSESLLLKSLQCTTDSKPDNISKKITEKSGLFRYK